MRQEALKQSTELNPSQPIGSSLVCSYCHSFHIWSECGHWGEHCPCCLKEAPESNVIPLKPKPQRKKKRPVYRFGAVLIAGTKKIKFEVAFKNGAQEAYYRRERRYVHISECDWVSNGGFDKACTYEDTGIIKENGKPLKKRKIGKREGNLTEIYRIGLDFDNPSLDPDLILQRLHYHNLPELTILRNPLSGRYQAFLEDPKPLPGKCASWSRSIAERLFKVFTSCEGDKKLFKCDPKVLTPSNYMRNVENPKYEIVHRAPKVSFGKFDRRLKESGFKDSSSSRKTPKNQAQPKIIFFLNSHNGILTTYEELFSQCGVTEPTGYRTIRALKRIGRVKTENIRFGSTYKTRFTLIKKLSVESEQVSDSHTINKEVVKLFPLGDSVECVSRSSQYVREGGVKAEVLGAVKCVGVVGLPFGWRNEGACMLSLGLKSMGFSESEVLKCLEMGFVRSRYVGDHEFSWDEFKQVVNSPFRNNYRYCMKSKSRKWDWGGFLRALVALECGNVIDLGKARKQ